MDPIKVATINIWNRSGPWEQRLPALRAEIARLDADILGLQEVLRGSPDMEGPQQPQLLSEGFAYHCAYGAAWNLGGMEFGNAVFSKFPIVRHEVFPLPNLDTNDWRCLLFAELDAPFGKVPFFVTHLNWRFEEGFVREAQVRKIAELVKAHGSRQEHPAILVGDFNATSDSNEIRFLKGLAALEGTSIYFMDAFAAKGAPGEGATFSQRNPFAADLTEPERRIDYIFVRGGTSATSPRIESCQLCFDQPHEGIYPSDHFGVVATVRGG